MKTIVVLSALVLALGFSAPASPTLAASKSKGPSASPPSKSVAAPTRGGGGGASIRRKRRLFPHRYQRLR